MSALLGTTLSGRYRLDQKIGSGGMSTVYLATDEKLERHVAIKVMNREVATDSEQLARFGREARAVAQVSHINVVGVIDAGEDAGHPYIVFEYVQGETLKDRIRRDGQLPITEAVAYAIEIARALGAAHECHIVHRDVKPQNVLIDAESGMAKVTDFGIARTLEEDGLTSDGRVIGTTDYVSPEQAMGRPVTGQSDLYSLGIVLYEMLTGELPFKAEGQVAVAMKHVREPMPDVRVLRPDVSATLATIVDRATAKDTRDRYATDAQLISDLEQVLALEASRAGEVSDPVTSVFESLPADTQARVPLSVRKKGRTMALFTLAAALIIAAIVIVIVRAEKGPPQHGHRISGQKPGPITICSSCASAYNPDAYPGPVAQNNSEAKNVVDGDSASGWTTQHYYTYTLGKPGVGLYVWTKAPVLATRLRLTTSTKGYSVIIYGSKTKPDPDHFDAGWQQIGARNPVKPSNVILLSPGTTKYRYFLVWITTLPPGQNYASINEIQLSS